MSENKLTLHSAIKHSFSEIERALHVEIVSIERVQKAYGSNANSFFIKTVGINNKPVTYFLKFGRENNIDNELNGDNFVRGVINTPKVVLFSKKKFFGYEWILCEYIHGDLMSEVFLKAVNKKELSDFFALEKKKENYLKKLNSERITTTDYANYIKFKNNELFRERFLGKRYKEFYNGKPNNISSLFNRNIFINGKSCDLTINKIMEKIKDKYKANRSMKIEAIKGQGDAHHGNILVNNDIWFIDNEYAGLTTPLMELAKPYYNDFLGTLFFHHNNILDKYFKITDYEDDGKNVHIKIKTSGQIRKYLEITRIKLLARKDVANERTQDLLSLNDYLILCHILTKNPNNYSQTTQKLFLVFIILLSLFNPYKPESIYSCL